MYDPTKSYSIPTWIPGLPKDTVTSFPFTFPTDPCELIITHASAMDHLPGPNMNAHISTVKGEISGIDAGKTGHPEEILCYAKNTRNGGAVTANYIAPGAACFLNVRVAPRRPGERDLAPGPTVTFGLLCNHAVLKA